jgi:activator of 2-hydroxyglutaryl-CoA dehydratase
MEDEVTFVGGVARQSGMVKALEETLKRKVNVSSEPHMVGALGAAVLALRRLEKLRGLGVQGSSKQEARVA